MSTTEAALQDQAVLYRRMARSWSSHAQAQKAAEDEKRAKQADEQANALLELLKHMPMSR